MLAVCAPLRPPGGMARSAYRSHCARRRTFGKFDGGRAAVCLHNTRLRRCERGQKKNNETREKIKREII